MILEELLTHICGLECSELEEPSDGIRTCRQHISEWPAGQAMCEWMIEATEALVAGREVARA